LNFHQLLSDWLIFISGSSKGFSLQWHCASPVFGHPLQPQHPQPGPLLRKRRTMPLTIKKRVKAKMTMTAIVCMLMADDRFI
jgi:hypothetical protein